MGPGARTFAAALLLAAGVCACDRGGDEDPSTSSVLGPEGGSLALEGFTLSVPEGALVERTELSVQVLEGGGSEVVGRVRVSRVFVVRPDTVRFLTPATVTLPYDPLRLPQTVPARSVDVRHTDFARLVPERLGSLLVDTEMVTVSGETSGLGTFWATAPEGPRAVSVTLRPESRTVFVGDTAKFTAEVRDQEGRVMSGQTIVWSASTPMVASVDEGGTATALAGGSTDIVARVGAASGKARLRVGSSAPFAQSFEQENPEPGASELWAVRAEPSGLLVAGSRGQVAVHSGGAWTRLLAMPLVRFRDVRRGGGEEVVAVGGRSGHGLLVRGGGASHSELVVPDTDLVALWLEGTAGMAVGEGPNLAVRAADGSWSVDATPVSEPLLAVDGEGGEPVVYGARGAVYRRSGAAWSALNTTPLPEYLRSVAARGEEALAVSQRRLWRFASGAWTAAPVQGVPALEYHHVAWLGSAVAIAGRDSAGKEWIAVDDGTRFVALAPDSPVNALGGTAADDLYAVGPAGFVAAWRGSGWVDLRSGPTQDLTALAAFAGPTVFAIGSGCADPGCASETSTLLRREAGGRFAPVAGPYPGTLRALAGKSANDVWAAGTGGTAYHLSGGAWQAVAMPSYSVESLAICSGVAWAGAWDGVLSEEGGVWTFAQRDVGVVRALACVGGAVFAAGDYSLYRIQSGEATPLDTTEDLIYPMSYRAAWGTPDGQAFLAGDARWILHWTGERFEAMDQPANVPIVSTRAIWGTSNASVWAGGVARDGASFLIHYNGAYWESVDPGLDGGIAAIAGLADGQLWLGGLTGALLRGAPPPLP